MKLLDLYNEFNNINKDYINYINTLVNSDLGKCGDNEVLNSLLGGKNKFEYIKIKVDEEKITEENIKGLMQLKYYIMDGIFLSVDLIKFYETKEIERFKMRAVNYINKDRMQRFINDNPFNSDIDFGKCRI